MGEELNDVVDSTKIDESEVAENSDIFIPPSAGADPLQQALKQNSQNVGVHVAFGDFQKALELLKK